jgi:hypothetical protein
MTLYIFSHKALKHFYCTDDNISLSHMALDIFGGKLSSQVHPSVHRFEVIRWNFINLKKRKGYSDFSPRFKCIQYRGSGIYNMLISLDYFFLMFLYYEWYKYLT